MSKQLNELESQLYFAAVEGPLTMEVIERLDAFIAIQPPPDYAAYVLIISRLNAKLSEKEKLDRVGSGSQRDNIYPIYGKIQVAK